MRVFIWVGIYATIAQCPTKKENSGLKIMAQKLQIFTHYGLAPPAPFQLTSISE